MALTFTPKQGFHHVLGNKTARVYDITFDSSYPTGGYSLVPRDVGLIVIQQILYHGVAAKSDGTSCVLPLRTDVTKKILLYWGNAGTASVLPEVTNGTDLSAYTVRATFVGY